MNSDRTIFLTSMAVAVVTVAALFILGGWHLRRINQGDVALRSALTNGLQDVLQRNDAIVAGMIGIKRTGRRGEPEAVVLAKVGSGRGAEDLKSRYGSAAVPGEGLVELSTLAFFQDRNLVRPDRMVPTLKDPAPSAGYGYQDGCPSELETTGQDSILLKQALLECPRQLADWLAVCDKERFRYTGYYLTSFFGEVFGDSDAFSIPRSQGGSPGTVASIADGTGVRLSQGQVLRFYDAVANCGIAAGHRYFRNRRICSEQTASLITSVLSRNVASGKDSLSVPFVRVAGKSASGCLEAGTIPGFGPIGLLGPPNVSSFVGFFPAEDPKYTMCVTLYSSPKGRETATREVKELFARIVNGMNNKGML